MGEDRIGHELEAAGRAGESPGGRVHVRKSHRSLLRSADRPCVRGYYNDTLHKGTPKLFALAGELRQNGHVPRYARPLDADNVEDPIKALGSMVRAGIIGYIRNHGASTRGEIAAGTGLAVPTVAKALQALVKSGMLIPDPPPEQAVSGQRIRYSVNRAAVSEMYFQLGIAIGEL